MDDNNKIYSTIDDALRDAACREESMYCATSTENKEYSPRCNYKIDCPFKENAEKVMYCTVGRAITGMEAPRTQDKKSTFVRIKNRFSGVMNAFYETESR